MSNSKKGLTLGEINKQNIIKKVDQFREFNKWTDAQYQEYEKLLLALKKAYRKCSKITPEKEILKTKEKGDTLENIVNYIVEKNFFLKVYPNKRTATHEIDQFIVLSDYGKQAMHEYNFSKELLGFENGYFLGECKNYDGKVPATWVGKFNTLLKVSGNCEIGVIFSYEGLTGEENNWYDAHGLTKIIFKMDNSNRPTCILDFNKSDFERILNRESFLDIIISKKEALASCTKSINLSARHEGSKILKQIYDSAKF